MRTIFLCGHGNWDPNQGFTDMPKGCSMTFYTHHAKTMLQDAVEQIVGGTYTGEPRQVVPEFKAVPNMRLSPDSDENVLDTWKALSENPLQNATLWFVQSATTLKDLFKSRAQRIWRMVAQHQGIAFHWTCCRYVDMPKMTYRLTPGGGVLAAIAGRGSVRGRSGFKASEDLVDDVYVFRDRTDHDRRIGPDRPRGAG